MKYPTIDVTKMSAQDVDEYLQNLEQTIMILSKHFLPDCDEMLYPMVIIGAFRNRIKQKKSK